MLNKRRTFLDTIVEEELACSRLDEEVSENGECSVSGETDAESGLDEHVEVSQDGTKTLDSDLSSIERCQSCEVYLEEQPHEGREEES